MFGVVTAAPAHMMMNKFAATVTGFDFKLIPNVVDLFSLLLFASK